MQGEMKHHGILGLTLVLIGCAARDERDPRVAVAAVLDDWHQAAARADEARYFGHLHDQAVFLGTDASERWSKAAFRSYAHPHFAAGKAWRFEAVRRAITIEGDVAWFDEDLATGNLGPARGSGVLRRHGGRWQIAHYNLALTVPNERFDLVKEAAGAAVRTSSGEDELATLAWLAGAWVGEHDGSVIEEAWLAPQAGSMIGSGRTIRDGETVFFEHLRIEVHDGRVIYQAQPLGRPPTAFTATVREADRVVFENREHDWPKRITYRRVAAGVEVRVDGDAGQAAETWTLTPAVTARR